MAAREINPAGQVGVHPTSCPPGKPVVSNRQKQDHIAPLVLQLVLKLFPS